MFVYVSIALGKFVSFRTLLVSSKFLVWLFHLLKLIFSYSLKVHSKLLLAFGGILVVAASVLCSLGIFGYVGLATTMLTIEVVPFLVLAVGVDNLFILVHAFNRLNKSNYVSASESVSYALGQVGPSILLTSMSECCCFGIGSLTDMPAVRTFALYSTVAILVNFILQITAFVALMTIDQMRYEVMLKITLKSRIFFMPFSLLCRAVAWIYSVASHRTATISRKHLLPVVSKIYSSISTRR